MDQKILLKYIEESAKAIKKLDQDVRILKVENAKWETRLDALTEFCHILQTRLDDVEPRLRELELQDEPEQEQGGVW